MEFSHHPHQTQYLCGYGYPHFCGTKIQPFNLHALRHTHATLLIENGANMKDVQQRLGHSKLVTTMDTYAHVTENMSKSTIDIFEKAVLPRSNFTVGNTLAKLYLLVS